MQWEIKTYSIIFRLSCTIYYTGDVMEMHVICTLDKREKVREQKTVYNTAKNNSVRLLKKLQELVHPFYIGIGRNFFRKTCKELFPEFSGIFSGKTQFVFFIQICFKL
jgi:hypothetical protein